MGCVGSLLLFRLFSSGGEWGLLSASSAQASRCDGSFCCKAQTLGHAGFSDYGPRALQDRLNSCGTQTECSGASGILPDQGSSLCLLHWQMDSLTLSYQGNPESTILNNIHNSVYYNSKDLTDFQFLLSFPTSTLYGFFPHFYFFSSYDCDNVNIVPW